MATSDHSFPKLAPSSSHIYSSNPAFLRRVDTYRTRHSSHVSLVLMILLFKPVGNCEAMLRMTYFDRLLTYGFLTYKYKIRIHWVAIKPEKSAESLQNLNVSLLKYLASYHIWELIATKNRSSCHYPLREYFRFMCRFHMHLQNDRLLLAN
jgi:hypothetical protein